MKVLKMVTSHNGHPKMQLSPKLNLICTNNLIQAHQVLHVIGKYLPANGFYFLVYEYLQILAKERTGSDQVSMVATIFAGGAAGIAYWLVGMPADVLKSRLQTDCPANGVYFLTYEAIRNFIRRFTHSEDVSMLASIFAGGVAGITYWIAGMPADVLKSRLQTAPDGTYKHGIRSVFIELMRKEGPTALYRGVIPVMIRAFPANAVTFLGIEMANNVMANFGI